MAVNFRKIMDHDQPWMLKADLDELTAAMNPQSQPVEPIPKPANVTRTQSHAQPTFH